MGLTITAYNGLSVASDEAHNVLNFNIPQSFREQAEDINEFDSYSYKEKMSGVRCSYSTYNAFRELIAKLAGYPKMSYKETASSVTVKYAHAAGAWDVSRGPFWELINFSDCEGIIGPKTSAKLVKDFDKFKNELSKDEFSNPSFVQFYNELRNLFDFASKSGVVIYH